MSEWLSDDQFRRAALLWIVDESAPWDEVHFALCHGIPLLVPADNASLVQVCLRAHCGLWYGDLVEAQRCLEFFFSNDEIRRAMGASGQAYLAALAS